MTDDIGTLETELAQAIAELHSSHDDRWDAAYAHVLDLERKVAAAKREPYAVTLDFPVVWDVGAPLPHVLADDTSAFLVFLLAEPDPNWDGTYTTVVSAADSKPHACAVVTFHSPQSVRFGSPNEDVHNGHYLYGKGMDAYTAQRVENSPWLREVIATNSVHQYFDEQAWQKLNHYIFWFHDTTFECLARGYEVNIFHDSMSAVLEMVLKRLYGG